MKSVWIVSDSIVSPLGTSTLENYDSIRNNQSGIKQIAAERFGDQTFYASLLDEAQQLSDTGLSRFENLGVRAAKGALQQLTLTPDPERIVFILSTTKGNIEFLKSEPNHSRISLHATAKYMAEKLGLKHSLAVSNACISGVLALITAQRFLRNGKFDHALVVGAEVLSPFIASGFQSLRALSPEPCMPFDKMRSGINLGEAGGAMFLTTAPAIFHSQPVVKITGAGLSNDANHISGPSRTGRELALAIEHALVAAHLRSEQIDSINAHGTATIFNDEMEAKAFEHAGLEDTPLNSLKGYYGHTLGAAGVVETIIAKHALIRNEIIGTKGCKSVGVSARVNVNRSLIFKYQKRVLKTASGFGGCNAALILEKE